MNGKGCDEIRTMLARALRCSTALTSQPLIPSANRRQFAAIRADLDLMLRFRQRAGHANLTGLRQQYRFSSGAHTGQELVDLDTKSIGLMLELAGMVAHHVRRLSRLAGSVREAGDLLADQIGTLGDGCDILRHLPCRRVLLVNCRGDVGRDFADPGNGGADA